MNNQTFITYFKVNGKTVTFERWNYKRLATVEKAINTLFDSDLWKVLLKKAANNAGESESSTAAAVTYKTDASGKTIDGALTTRIFTI